MASEKSLSQEQTAVCLQQQLYTLEKNVSKELYSLEEIGEMIPNVMLVDNFIAKSNDYMNRNGCQVLQHTSEELNLLGEKYFTRFFEPTEVVEIFQLAGDLIQSQDPTRVINFFQRVRPHEEAPYEWYHMTSKLMAEPGSGTGQFERMIMVGTRVNDMPQIANKVNRVLEENEFAKKHFNLFAQLTRREKEILSLMALGNKNREIAEKTYIAEATVEQHRKNIRRKLQIKSLAQLIKFALAFDLI